MRFVASDSTRRQLFNRVRGCKGDESGEGDPDALRDSRPVAAGRAAVPESNPLGALSRRL
jgi:hypothetical protein